MNCVEVCSLEIAILRMRDVEDNCLRLPKTTSCERHVGSALFVESSFPNHLVPMQEALSQDLVHLDPVRTRIDRYL